MSANTEQVLAFIQCFGRMDTDEIMGFLDPACLYHNMPFAPVTGHAAIRGVLDSFTGMATQIEWRVRSVAEAEDGTVLTERTDRFLIAGKWVELPVMGAFELADGAITAWRDYFDMEQFRSQLPAS